MEDFIPRHLPSELFVWTSNGQFFKNNVSGALLFSNTVISVMCSINLLRNSPFTLEFEKVPSLSKKALSLIWQNIAYAALICHNPWVAKHLYHRKSAKTWRLMAAYIYTKVFLKTIIDKQSNHSFTWSLSSRPCPKRAYTGCLKSPVRILFLNNFASFVWIGLKSKIFVLWSSAIFLEKHLLHLVIGLLRYGSAKTTRGF